MKKLLVVMLSLCMMIGLTACGGGSSVLPTKTISTDEFITSLKKGLEKRWKILKQKRKIKKLLHFQIHIIYKKFAQFPYNCLNNFGLSVYLGLYRPQ